MSTWKIWKSGFDRWEQTTSSYLDKGLRSPALLGPVGKILKTVLQTKTAASGLVERGWNAVGLTSRNQQDYAVHRINQLESQVLDLKEELRDLRDQD